MMSASRLQHLLALYQRRAATPAEEEELMALLEDPANKQLVDSWINRVIEDNDTGQAMPEEHAAHILEAIFQAPEKPLPARVRHIRSPARWAAAAAILGVLVLGAYFWQKRAVQTEQTALHSADVPPGKSQAVLVLADGVAVQLDSAGNRVLQQGGTAIRQVNGQLQYASQGNASGEPAYNELKTPRGGHFRIQMADGTIVWLNAGSSLKYPAAFTGNERTVELSGEAYFEVAGDAAKPFHVTAGNIKVQVLGTHFNIKAYQDEQTINTTLLKGAVKVTGTKGSSLLKPGEQARIAANGDLSVMQVNAEDAVAWKNGMFVFKGAGLKTVMREISRWYDVDVKFENQVKEREFAGKISRNYTLQEVLSVLQASNVHFRLEGKVLTVIP